MWAGCVVITRVREMRKVTIGDLRGADIIARSNYAKIVA
jgi:hypothetical protein